ncbi:hypothetical protein ACW2Q0_28375 [Nocardia sp. R16R-3T]
MGTRIERIRHARNNWRRRALTAEAALERATRHGGDIERTILTGTDFNGCTDRNPNYCDCATWTPIRCASCGEILNDGSEVFWRYSATPWFAEDEPGRWDADHWHVECDGGVNADLVKTE